MATELGRLDVGQAVIVSRGWFLAWKALRERVNLSAVAVSINVRGEGRRFGESPQTSAGYARVDLPTIGDKTVQAAYDSGLSGICLHSGNRLIVNEKETIKLADKLGIFVLGLDVDDYR